MAQIKKSTLFLGVAVLAGLVAAVKFFMPSKSDDKSPSTVSGEAKNMPTQSANSTSPKQMEKSAQNMTETPNAAKSVSTKISYQNPSGADEVGFTLSVDTMGMITDVKTDILATNEISKKRQAAFAEGLPSAVKGKKLSDLASIDKVGGSSLTTKAFNDSLAVLKSSL